MELVYENVNGKVYVDRAKKLVVQKWTSKPVQFDAFKQAIDKTVEIFKTNPVELLLSDTREQPVPGIDSTNYAASVVPVLSKNGMKKMAFLMSKNVLVKLGISNFTSAANMPDFIKHFDNEDDVDKWFF